MKNRILILSLISATLLFNGCANNGTLSKNDKEKEIMLKAKKAIKLVGGTLKKTMISKMKEGGPVKAADFCSKEATNLAKNVSKKLPKGIKIKRITSKPRNSNNMATKEELLVLQELETKMKRGNMPKMLVKKISDSHYQVYKPLKIKEKCLICHGSKDTRDEDAYKIIYSKYHNDKAINYNVGDLRGAFLIDIKV